MQRVQQRCLEVFRPIVVEHRAMSDVLSMHGHLQTLQGLESRATRAHQNQFELLRARLSKECCHMQLSAHETANAFLWQILDSALDLQTSNGSGRQ